MTITLGDLRTFCAEVASPDSSGSTHDREAMIWINNALQRLAADADWDELLHSRNLTLLPSETGTTMDVTQGSLAVTVDIAESIETKYLDDEWEFIIEGESRQTFFLGTRTDAQNATFRAGDEWVQASATDVDWTAIKTKYPLPDDAREITRAEILSTYQELTYLPNHTFDFRKSRDPTRLGDPEFFTLRNNKIEIWPHQGAGYDKLSITYRKGVSVIADAAVNATVIDWPDEWRDLLFKAIALEASITQGQNSPIPYNTALIEYEHRLRKYRGLNSNKANQVGPMNLHPPRRMYFPEIVTERDREIPDV